MLTPKEIDEAIDLRNRLDKRFAYFNDINSRYNDLLDKRAQFPEYSDDNILPSDEFEALSKEQNALHAARMNNHPWKELFEAWPQISKLLAHIEEPWIPVENSPSHRHIRRPSI